MPLVNPTLGKRMVQSCNNSTPPAEIEVEDDAEDEDGTIFTLALYGAVSHSLFA
jgi:hypothetical protein